MSYFRKFTKVEVFKAINSYIKNTKINKFKLFHDLMKLNPELIFFERHFDLKGYDEIRCVFFTEKYKYSIINSLSIKTPKILNSQITNGLCRSNRINIEYSEKVCEQNYVIINGERIIFDEELYVMFPNYTDNLADHIENKLKQIVKCDYIKKFDDEIIYIYDNKEYIYNLRELI